MVRDDPKEILFLCALQNAVKHGGVPQAGAVIGMVMGAHPELRSRAKEVSALAKEAIADVAALSPEERVARSRPGPRRCSPPSPRSTSTRRCSPISRKQKKGLSCGLPPTPPARSISGMPGLRP